MKILAGRREDILRRKADYEARLEEYNKKSKEQSDRFRKAEQDVLEPVRSEVLDRLSKYSALSFDVRAKRNWSSRGRGEGIEVRVECDEHRKFEDDSALSWDYTVSLNADGEVTSETGSWSGLKATTKEQLTSLRQTVDALEELNNMDWKSLLDKTMPDYKDYYDPDLRKPDREDFEEELKAADLEELVGQNKFIEVEPFESSGYRGPIYLKLIRETPSQYEVMIAPQYVVDEGRLAEFNESHSKYTQRVRKSSVKPKIRNGETHIVDIS